MGIDREAGLLRAKIQAVYDGEGNTGDLGRLCLDLVARQKDSWPELREGYGALEQVRQRQVQCRGFSVVLQHNPGRMKSTTARVDEEGTRARPCFLCPHNLPEAQKGILYRNDYLVLCNPMPVFASHFTVSTLQHQPQSLNGGVYAMLELAADLGEGWLALYNGPRCGASAPDHLHFQAMPAGRMPIERQIGEGKAFEAEQCVGEAMIRRGRELGREAVLVQGRSMEDVALAVSGFIAALKSPAAVDAEPMLNIIALRAHQAWRVIIFPRAKHRPEAFCRTDDTRILVSPAVVEMAGVLVTPLEKDFERLDAAAIEAIYREVSLERRTVEAALAKLKEFTRRSR